MSFKSFKDLGVSAERLGSFCKRWMARVQRSGSFFLPPSISLHLPPSLLPSPPLLSLAELYRLVLVLSANQALGFGFVLFFPLKIILFLPPAENHKRESGAIKTATLLNLVSLNWFPAILSGPQASLTATSALHT